MEKSASAHVLTPVFGFDPGRPLTRSVHVKEIHHVSVLEILLFGSILQLRGFFGWHALFNVIPTSYNCNAQQLVPRSSFKLPSWVLLPIALNHILIHPIHPFLFAQSSLVFLLQFSLTLLPESRLSYLLRSRNSCVWWLLFSDFPYPLCSYGAPPSSSGPPAAFLNPFARASLLHPQAAFQARASPSPVWTPPPLSGTRVLRVLSRSPPGFGGSEVMGLALVLLRYNLIFFFILFF